MDTIQAIDDEGTAGGNYSINKSYIKPGFLWKIGLIFISLIAGAALIVVPDKYVFALLFVPPAIITGYFILIRPYIGIYLFILFDFLRPYDIIPALLPLRLPMIIEALTLTSWLFSLVKNKNLKWFKLQWAFLILLFTIGLTVLTAPNNFFAYQKFQLVLIYLIICVVAGNIDINLKQLTKLIWLLILIHTYLSIQAIMNYASGQFVFGGQQTSGGIGSGFLYDENDIALAFTFIIPFAYYMIFQSRKLWHKSAAFVSLLILIGGVVATFSRGGMLALASILIFCILSSKKKLMSFAVVLLIILVMIPIIPNKYWSEAETISSVHEGTAEARLQYWEAAWRMYLDHPIIGVGAGNGGVVLPDYVSDYFGDPGTQWGRVFHGTIPQVMAELGTIGLAAYFYMIYYILKIMFGIRKKTITNENDFALVQISNMILGSLIAYFVASIFISTPYYPQFYTLLILTTILYFINQKKEAEALEELSSEPSEGGSLQT